MTQFNSSKKKGLSNESINKTNPPVNRGVELMLQGGKKRKKKPFHITLKKISNFFNKEIEIYFEFSLSIKNKN